MLRFAVVLSLALALASAVILLVVHQFALSQAEQSATRQAGLVASTLLQREVRPTDLDAPVPVERRRELDVLFRTHVLAEDTLGVLLVRRDGLVTYATDHRAIGTVESKALSSEAAGGTIVSRVSAPSSGRKTLDTYAPVGPGGGGAALISQAYAPIESAARAAELRVGVVLEALLVALFLVFVPLLSRVTKRIKQQIERIHFQAYYDGLTGLPNRAHLFERLQLAVGRAAEEDRTIAILLLDLDRFREINDTLGHDAGDTLLEETAARLRDTVEEETILARLGADEFAVVVEYADEDQVNAFAERLRAAIEPPIVIEAMPVGTDGTVGIAYYPKDGTDAESLVKHAEVATYTAKDWRVGVLAYSPAVDPHDPEQLGLVAALRDAIEHGELVLHYQPKVEIATGSIAGFEALAYWQHPTRGLLPPGAFVPVAERTGAIRHLSHAVLADAVEQLAAWEGLGVTFTVAVNLSAIDLLDLELPQFLEDLLKQHDVDPTRLCLEVTESAVMADPQKSTSILERIVATGARVAIDDFGTGHSSLAYLKDLPAQEVKIDRAFVTGMARSLHDRLIVQATIQLGHSFGFQVVAEGVETEEVLDVLRELGCDYAQGYLYGRPEPAKTITRAAWSRAAA